MSSKKVLLIAAAAGLIAVILTNLYVEGRVSEKRKEGQVIVLKKDLAPGDALDPGNLTTMSVPKESELWRRAYAIDQTRDGSARDAIARLQGLRVRRALRAGDVLLMNDVVGLDPISTDLVAGFAARQGDREAEYNTYRAVSFPVSATSAVSGLILPGDRVDLVVGVSGQAGQSRAKVFLQNVLLVAVNGETDSGNILALRESRPVSSATVLVPVQDASAIFLASIEGSIGILLRSMDHAEIEKVETADLESLLERPEDEKGD